jgi:hypothetical protein
MKIRRDSWFFTACRVLLSKIIEFRNVHYHSWVYFGGKYTCSSHKQGFEGRIVFFQSFNRCLHFEMMRIFAAVAVPTLAAAHALECSELGSIGCQPAWVKQFSTPTAAAAAGGPEQLWINYGATYDAMTFGWLTSNMTAGSTVQYGTASGKYTNSASGNATFYKYSASYTSGLIHHVW